jgi:scyllo-inositol 2-dehydrogenase (NADP+)
MMKANISVPIKVAIAGYGRSGYNIHAACLRRMPHQFKIVAVADELAERRADAKNEFGAKTFKDWSALIAHGEFDVLVNALPSPLHLPVSVKALNAGKHVLCEKPLCGKVKDFDRLVAAAKKNDRIFYPFQNYRYQPYFIKIREIIDSGVLGEIVYVRSTWGSFRRRWDWQTLQANLGGSLFNTGPHALDQSLALLDWRKPGALCRMSCHNELGGDADDHCAVTLYDPKRVGPQVDIMISSYIAYPHGGQYNIGGTLGGLTGNSQLLNWRFFDPTQAEKHRMWKKWSVDRNYPEEKLPWSKRTWTYRPKKDLGTGYTIRAFPSGTTRIYQNLHDILTGNAEQLITHAQVRQQIAILEECHRQNKLPKNP